MKRSLVILVVAAQFAVIAFMAAQREWIARTGETLTLRTAPIDPMDPMRGEYVRFSYEISRVPAELFRDKLVEWAGEKDWRAARRFRDEVVYATVRVGESGFAELASVSDQRPASGLFLRGRVEFVESDNSGVKAITVRYGVEAMFMQQGEGRKIEELAAGEKAGVPSNVTVNVGRSGIAVLRSFAWEPLGLTIRRASPLEPGSAQSPATAFAPAPRNGPHEVVLTLKNHSDHPLAIVDAPRGRSFRLRTQNLGKTGYRWANENAAPVEFSPNQIVVLQPGDTHEVLIDLADEYWRVTANDGKPPHAVALPEIDGQWAAQFRFEYMPPTRDQVRGAPNASLIRHVPLSTRRFTAAEF